MSVDRSSVVSVLLGVLGFSVYAYRWIYGGWHRPPDFYAEWVE